MISAAELYILYTDETGISWNIKNAHPSDARTQLYNIKRYYPTRLPDESLFLHLGQYFLC